MQSGAVGVGERGQQPPRGGVLDTMKLIIIEIRSTLRKVDSNFMIGVPSQVIKGLKLTASDNNYWTLNTLLL